MDWDQLLKEAIHYLQEYLQIQTVNPPGNEVKGARFLKKILDKDINVIVPSQKQPEIFAKEQFPHKIHIGRLKTPSIIIDDRQFTDTLFKAVDQAMKFIVSYISVAFEFDGSLQRKERFAYPLPAIREALLNAVVHRDYTDGSDIQIKIYDDHITIYSPGLLYGGLKLVELNSCTYKSRLRNQLGAEAFLLTGNIEQ